MLELLRGMLEKLGYKVVQAGEANRYQLYNNSEDNCRSGFILTDITGIDVDDFLIETQAEIADWLTSTLPASNSSEKNCVLILTLGHAYPEERVAQIVSKIEEDQYFFKKQVIFYTSLEIEKLLDSIDQASPFNALESILYDRDRFVNYSNNNSDEVYSLTARLFSKLPFLTIQQAGLEIPDLGADIKLQLENKNLCGLRDELLQLGSNEADISRWLTMILEKE